MVESFILKTLILMFCLYISAGVDFSRRNISFSVAPWENTSVIQFEVFDDNIQESSENFLALLYLSESSVGAETSRNIILLTIEDDDGMKDYPYNI